MSVLDTILNEKSYKKRIPKYILPITTLNANKSQLSVITEIENSDIVSVLGGAGVGKSQTIVNVASHFIATNRNVLIVASSDEAVNVVSQRLNCLCGIDICLRAGRKDSNIRLANKLLDIIEGKIDLQNNQPSNILKYFIFRNEEEAKKLLKSKVVKQLSELISDVGNRRNLIIQAKMNLESKQSKKEKLMQQIDFKPILKAYPAWAITAGQVSAVLPFIKNLFDLCIIDEGSMGNIAEYLPILHRAKKCVSVGDPHQISHICWLETKKEISFAKKYEIPENLQLIWSYRKNSIWDFLNYYADKTIMLDEYYRGFASIFKFSNEKFYGNKIKIMTDDTPNAVIKIKVNGKIENGINIIEAEKAIDIVKSIINECEKTGKVKTIGILSPIRKQCDYIVKRLQEEIKYNLIEKYKIQCGTAHAFQGNQRAIMINSFVYAPNSPHQTLTFINNPNLLNVTITRAEEQVINLYSNDNMGNGLIAKYLASIKVN